jgi:hypothetical protein
LNAALKHLTPQQLATIKARLPAYMRAVQRCTTTTGGDQNAMLACIQRRMAGVGAP